MTGKDLTQKIYSALDVCLETKKLKHGILSEGTASEVKGQLVKLLRAEGLYYEEALMVINQLWAECQPALTASMKALDKNTKQLFTTLKDQGMKIAICTGDERHTVLRDLNKLGLMSYVMHILLTFYNVFLALASHIGLRHVCLSVRPYTRPNA
jgi:phosphoglycolate phosphatase-like HAD superfamily hydrolase